MIFEIILGILLVIEGYIIWNLMRKAETLETWIDTLSDKIMSTQRIIKEIDSTGHFEADDEIGTIFDGIKDTVNELNKAIERE
jgi:hypothetical protein